MIGALQAQRVGIGITTPLEKLHVDSNIKIGVGIWSSPLTNRYFKIGDGNGVTIGEVGLDDRLEFSAREFIFRNSGVYGPSLGKVGINISGSPTAFLEINGDIKITDGNQGEGRVLTSDGFGTGSWKPLPSLNTGFQAKLQNANMDIAPSTDYTVVFDSEEFDDGSGYDGSTGFFTAPAEGVYAFNVKIQWQLTPNTQTLLSVVLERNGSTAEEAKDFVTGSGGNDLKTISFSTVLRLGPLDVVKVVVKQESGDHQQVVTSGSSISGHRLY